MDRRLPGDFSNDDLLVSWKDIAGYLKCSVRKAQRLEGRQLPVNRIVGTKSVWASKSEIDRWLRSQAEKTKKREEQFATLAGSDTSGYVCSDTCNRTLAVRITGVLDSVPAGWLRLLFAVAVGLTVGAAIASAYALTIVFFGTAAVFLVATYPALANTSWMRAVAGGFMIGGMAYCITATTLPHMVESVVNMATLRPALAYPIAAGLRFIPSLVLIAVFLAVLCADSGFAENRRSRTAYLLLGVLFLLLTAGIALGTSGAHRIWQAALPIRWTLLAGESFVLAVNVQLFILGYRFFNTTSLANYNQLLKQCGTGFLVIALTAAILGRHWNETVRYHIDIRMPNAYRVASADPAQDIRNWLAQHPADAGPDLISLSTTSEFLQALRAQEFYKHDFDEAFQVPKKAVIFGYKSAGTAFDKQPSFVLVRFPADLAAMLRFGSVRAR